MGRPERLPIPRVTPHGADRFAKARHCSEARWETQEGREGGIGISVAFINVFLTNETHSDATPHFPPAVVCSLLNCQGASLSLLSPQVWFGPGSKDGGEGPDG